MEFEKKKIKKKKKIKIDFNSVIKYKRKTSNTYYLDFYFPYVLVQAVNSHYKYFKNILFQKIT